MDDLMMEHGDKVSIGCGALIVLAVVGFLGFVFYATYQHATGIQSGYVFKKDYSPASETTTYQTITTGKTTTTIPVKHQYNESYKLYFRVRGEDGKTQENYADVPADVWQKAQIGQWFDGDCFCVVAK